MDVKITLLEWWKCPDKTDGTFYNLYAKENGEIGGLEKKYIMLWIKLEIPEWYYWRIENFWFLTDNWVDTEYWVIHSDFRDEVYIKLKNTTEQEFQYGKWDILWKLSFHKIEEATFIL